MSRPEGYSKCACRQCGGAIEFPDSGVGQNITCPHCNKLTVLTNDDVWTDENHPEETQSGWPYVILAVLLLAAAGAGGWQYWKSRPKPAPPPPVVQVPPTNAVPSPPPAPPPDPWKGLMASPVTLEKQSVGSLIYAAGAITNKSDHERFAVKVELDIFDSNNDKIGTATDYTGSILPGKEWHYRALVTARNGASAELTAVKEN